MRWNVKNSLKQSEKRKRIEEVVSIVLSNRNIKTEKKREDFLNPPKPQILSGGKVGFGTKQLQKAISRIKKAVKDKELVVVYGDYDADGICATAIMWESLFALGAKAIPYIPHRKKHGYGLSVAGVKDLLKEVRPPRKLRGSGPLKPGLIVTVDNGIVAHEAAEYVAKENIDLIITDHHVKGKKLPKSLAVIHSTKLAGAGVAWVFCQELIKSMRKKVRIDNLDLAMIGSVADMVPLLEFNRSIVKHGLEAMRKTKRVGLLAMLDQARVNANEVSTYHINFVIAPRINAMGRLEHGMDSLRLLCTRKKERGNELARVLGETNKSRQELTDNLLKMAFSIVGEPESKLLFVEHEEFHEGVIGLVAGKLVEKHYRPAIVIERGKETSKASARSVAGVNIIELIRKSEDMLINAGGHPMAAGFTIETKKLDEFREAIMEQAEEMITDDMLKPRLSVDCELDLTDIDWPLYKKLTKMEPFGIGNPRPTFVMRDVTPLENMAIGKERNHLKLLLPSKVKSQATLPALWFGKGNIVNDLGEKISLAFVIDENTWNGKTELQLRIKDIK